METIIRRMTGRDAAADEETVSLAAGIWRRGGLVAFPTETVYGLGGNGLDADASRKIYAAKGRPSDNPLILHIAKREQLDTLISGSNSWGGALMDAFWPGPLTLIFRKSDRVPKEVTGGLDTVAVRMPSHPAAKLLLSACGFPIAAPSANRSGRPSPTKASHVIDDMDGRIDLIIDGGEVGIGVESTIVDLTGAHPVLLRPGFITLDMLEPVIGPVETDQAVFSQVSEKVRPKAPGMKYRHYAPKAEMTLVEGDREAVAAYINERIRENPDRRTGLLITEENRALYRGGCPLCVGSRGSMDEIAHNLFDVLREFDAMGVDRIYSESFPSGGEGLAVMNRLLKAAGHQIVRV